MSRHEYETIDLTPTNKHEDTDPRPVHIKYGDVAMDLPRLDDSSQLPTSMLIAGMTAASQGWNNLDDDQKLAFMATMLAWLLILIDLCLNHPAAIQYDWIAAWGHPLDLTRQPLYEAWPMCREILKNHDTSHAYAALAGNSYLPGQT